MYCNYVNANIRFEAALGVPVTGYCGEYADMSSRLNVEIGS